jgi:hypothetical protein
VESENLGMCLPSTMTEDPAYVQLARDRQELKSRLATDICINDYESSSLWNPSMRYDLFLSQERGYQGIMPSGGTVD